MKIKDLLENEAIDIMSETTLPDGWNALYLTDEDEYDESMKGKTILLNRRYLCKIKEKKADELLKGE